MYMLLNVIEYIADFMGTKHTKTLSATTCDLYYTYSCVIKYYITACHVAMENVLF